jgi:hypothetical protein
MAAVSTSRRSTAGIVFIIAGALLAIAILLPLLGGPSVAWLGAIAYLAIAVAFAILGIGAVNSTLAKVLLIATAVGLVAAIPATIAYNYVDKRISDLMDDLTASADVWAETLAEAERGATPGYPRR